MTVILLAGGLDSAVLSRLVDRPRALTILYGQRHHKEIEFAQRQAEFFDMPWQYQDIGRVFSLAANNALTGDLPTPEGHYTSPTQEGTVVPYRNGILLRQAVTLAEQTGEEEVVYGAQADDYEIYLDCRPDWVHAYDQLTRLETNGQVQVRAPLMGLLKWQVVLIGEQFAVPFALTWSCYRSGVHHCGRCGACVERQEAFHRAGIQDPVRYHDPDYWKTVT